MKNDLRVRYTQSVIQNAFLELLCDKPVNRIAVKEVCEKAGINRGTFYKHYLDCYDLMDKLEQRAIADFDAVLASAKDVGEEKAMLAVLRTVQDNRDMVSRLAARAGGEHFLRQLAEHYFARVEYPDTVSGTFLAAGCAGVMEYWVRSGMAQPPEQVASEIVALMNALRRGLGAQ